MSLFDLLVLIIVGVSVVTGFVAGFARVGIGFLGAVAGVLFGFWFYGFPAEWVHRFIQSTAVSNLIGFFLVFSFFLCLAALAGKLLSKLFKWTGLSWLDKLMGAAFGLARGLLIGAAFIAVVLAFTPKPAPNWMVDSKVLPYAMGATDMIAALAPAGIKNAFRDTMHDIRQTWSAQLRKTREELTGRIPKSDPVPEVTEPPASPAKAPAKSKASLPARSTGSGKSTRTTKPTEPAKPGREDR